MAGRTLMRVVRWGCKKMTSAAGIGNSKGKENREGTCHCNISAREIRSSK
jgi:hypothetical protein